MGQWRKEQSGTVKEKDEQRDRTQNLNLGKVLRLKKKNGIYICIDLYCSGMESIFPEALRQLRKNEK